MRLAATAVTASSLSSGKRSNARDRHAYFSKLGHVPWARRTCFPGILFILPWLPPALIEFVSTVWA